MRKKAAKRDADVVALAGAMLQNLVSLKQQGGEAYPPRLRQLAVLAGGAPTDEQIQKAASKKVFTEKAVVTEKVNKKPALDALVYVKGDEPKPDPIGDLARRMLAVLTSQKPLGIDAYPPTLSRLVELCGTRESNKNVPKAVAHKALSERAIVAAKPGGQAKVDPLVILREDIAGDIAAILPALLRFALSPVTTRSKGKETETAAFTPEDASKRLVPDLQKPMLEALRAGIARQELPDDVAWVLVKGKPCLFLVENLRPAGRRPTPPAVEGPPAPSPVAEEVPVEPARGFAAAFREAFAQLDRRNGATNFVKLADLRRALAGFDRDEFDAALRVSGEFSLDSHEGLHGSLTPEEREAGVRQSGSLLIYVSRR